MRSQAGPVTEILETGMKISHMNTPAWATGTKLFYIEQLHFLNMVVKMA